MLSSILSRPATATLIKVVFMAAQMLGWITAYAQTSEPAGSVASSTTPPPNSLPAERRALREFDRFLDHHPLLEDQLRRNPQLAVNQAFLEKNPELRDFLHVNPNVAEGLKTYPLYYLNRALFRQAGIPVSFAELARFKDLFQQQEKLRQQLTQHPEWIRDPGFLETHAALRDFLVQHPELARAFLPPPNPPKPQ